MPTLVSLITSTPEPDRVVAAAARLCYSPVPACDLAREFSLEEAAGLLKHLRRSGHLSPFEHASFVFA